MRRPPLSIAVIGAIFLALAVLDLYRGLAPLVQSGHLAGDDVTVLGIAAWAAVGGVFLVRGHDWARWLLAAWMALHVALSVGRAVPLVVHTLVFGTLLFFLFRPRVRGYFRGPAPS